MKILPLLAAMLSVAAGWAAPAGAAERGYSVTDFDRIRVDGPYRVTLATGRSPSARATGSPGAIDALSVEVQGRTLIVRRNSAAWGGQPGRADGSVELRLSTPAIRAAALNGAGSLSIDRLRGASIDLSVSGAGLLSVGAIEADRLTAGVIGSGRMTLAGRAAIAQIGVRGTGGIDGAALVVKDAKVGAEGPGDIKLSATDTANVLANGSGSMTVLGNPACTVKASGSAAVVCGR